MQNHLVIEETHEMRPKCQIFAGMFVRITLFRSMKYKMG